MYVYLLHDNLPDSFTFNYISTTWVAECIYSKSRTTAVSPSSLPTNQTTKDHVILSFQDLTSQLLLKRFPRFEMSSSSNSSIVPEEGVRMGAFALTLYSLVSLVYTCVLPTLLTTFGIKPIYMFSQGLFALCMLATNGATLLSAFSVNEPSHMSSSTLPTTPAEILAVILVALCGISWATSMVVPFSLIGNYVNQGGDGGLILGIHNIFIVLPQIMTTLLSSLVFILFNGPWGLQIILTFSGLCSIGSTVWIYLLKETS